MNLLALDTATEQCSVALQTQTGFFERIVPTARGHADLLLPLIQDVLAEGNTNLEDLQGLAFGRGPGSFTGVRIAVSVIQGLSLATRLPVAGISNLAALAQRAISEHPLRSGQRVLTCMDARMQEVYWAVYEVDESNAVRLVGEERVSAPNEVRVDPESIAVGMGSAWGAYERLRTHFAALNIGGGSLPRAREIAQLGAIVLAEGKGVDAAGVQPVYLRDQVAWPSQK